ncbi:NUDIX hydrolase [Sciscionella marina]|uniref:NUDIX hydrolase n=1 Tax=Sciscionella marina TaxID=508770 RepID=UPI000371809E|nr:NUDIX hydrolase [Sciscionella marina]
MVNKDDADTNLRCSVVVYRGDDVLLCRRRSDWVLPGGTPRRHESTAAAARRETVEEAGLQVAPTRVAFVLETVNTAAGHHLVEIVFLAHMAEHGTEPVQREDGLVPQFVSLAELHTLRLSPPIGGHIRALHRQAGATGAYLGNVWRPQPAEEVE